MALGIGTGTTTPTNPITIQQTSVHWPYIALTNSSGVTKSQFGYQVNDDLLDIVANSGGIKFRTSGTETMRLTSAGNLGIGTSSPSSTLDVNGDASVSGTLTVSGDIDVGAQNGTWVKSDHMTDSIGWNSLHGVYIGSDTSGSNEFIYGDGTIRTGGAYYDLWHSGNDGSGSGLDADTVDGIQASSFLRSDTSDSMSGQLLINNNSANPLELQRSSQVGIEFNDTSTGSRYLGVNSGNLRYGSNLDHSTNSLVWTSGNDGSGSGLDADTLDGVEGSNYLRSDQADTIDGNLTIGGTAHIAMQQGHYVNRRFEVDNADSYTTIYILLCRNAANNDVNGTITMDRTSGLRHACKWDIIVSSGSSTTPVGSLMGHSVAGSGQPDARLVTLTYYSLSYVALEITNPDAYHETTGAYFNGRIVSSGSNTFTAVNSGQVSSIATLSRTNSKAVVGHRLDVDGYVVTPDIYLSNTIYHEGDTDTKLEFGTNQVDIITGGTYARLNVNGLFMYDGNVHEDYDALSGTTPTINAFSGGMFSLTMTGNTTFTFSSVSSGFATGFILQLVGNGSTVTWPTSVDWAGGTAPDAPASGETDIYVFITRDGGTTWYGVQSIDAAA